MSREFIYILPPARSRTFKTRSESYIIRELELRGIGIHQLNRFYQRNLRKLLSENSIDGIIFSSLKVILRHRKLLDRIRKTKIPLYWWYFDTANASQKRLMQVISVAKFTNLFFNKDKSNFEHYRSEGIHPVWLDQGTPESCRMSSNVEYKYEIGFFGSYNTVHQNRSTLLKEMDEKFRLVIYTPDVKTFNRAGFKHVRPAVSQQDIGLAVAQIKIVLVTNYSDAFPGYWSDRIHLMAGSGAFCLAPAIEGLQELYEADKDVVYYSGAEDLLDKISIWLHPDHDSLREEIRRQAFHTAHQKNSYSVRVNEFLREIEAPGLP